MQLSIFDLPPAPEPVIAPDLLAELTQAADELRSHPDIQPTMAMLDALPEAEPAKSHVCGVCFDCPGTLTGNSWQCAVNPDHRALVDLAALGRDLPANWITDTQDLGSEPDSQDLTTPDLLPVAVGIEGSACNFCQAPMVKHHPDLPVWRCTADEWHRFWLSKDGEGRKAKRIGVWLGHSRADPGSGPGEIPEWAEK